MVTSGEKGTRAGGEGVLTSSGEQVERGSPLLWSHHFEPLTIRLPVPRTLQIDTLDEVVTHHQIGQHHTRLLPKRRRQNVLVDDVREGPPLGDPSHDARVQLAYRRLERRQRFDREQL